MRLLRIVACNFVIVCLLGIPATRPLYAQKLIGQPRSFPIVISKPGSYKLRSNLTVPDANTTAISVTADNVTIDLNGFSILGPAVCSGGRPATSCTPTGTGIGIDSATSGKMGTTVVNGSVQGMGHHGLFLGQRARVERVRAVSNGGSGIWVAYDATLAGNTAVSNGGSAGISTNGPSTIIGNVADGNAGAGIVAGTDSVLKDNVVTYSGGEGITIDRGTVVGNVSTFNGGTGIFTDSGPSVVSENIASNNVADGIHVSEYSAVVGNSAGPNGGYGISGAISSTNGYAINVMSDNVSGTITGATDMGHNLCNGSMTCP